MIFVVFLFFSPFCRIIPFGCKLHFLPYTNTPKILYNRAPAKGGAEGPTFLLSKKKKKKMTQLKMKMNNRNTNLVSIKFFFFPVSN